MSKSKDENIIAITRPVERSEEAVNIVKSLGGVPLLAPTLELKISCTDSLRELCQNINDIDWLIFTSPASVESIFRFCPNFAEELSSGCKIAVIGPKTSDVVTENGLNVDMVPSDYTAEGLLDSFKSYDLEGKKIGVPRTLAARKVLPDGLKERGATVFIAEAYESIIPHNKTLIKELIYKILSLELTAVTFTSPLTVKNLFEVAGEEKSQKIRGILAEKKVLTAAIGPITGKVLIDYGIEPIIPPKYTVKDMMEELFNYL